jgi:hypothetical protein
MADQNRDVTDALAQGRGKDREDFEAVVEIAAEFLVGDHFGEVAIGGGDQAHVHRNGTIAAEALDLALLQGAQQLGLQVERQLADFVEEKRAFVRQFDAADLAGNGAGERALLVAEQFAFQQAGRDGGAVQLDEGVFAARLRR